MATKKKNNLEGQPKSYDVYCSACGKEKSTINFYTSNQAIHDNDIYHRRYPICKKCIKDKIYRKDTGQIDKNEFKKMLQKLDLPFLNNQYLIALSDDKETFGTYIKNLNIKFKGKEKICWEDGEISELEEKEKIINNMTDINKNELKELQKFWGKNYSIEQYEDLQNFYDDFIAGFECDSPTQVLNFKNAAKTQLMADESLSKGEIPAYNQLMKTLSTILGDSNVKPVQATGADGNDQISFGVLIKKYENDRPIHEDLDNEMKRYIDTYMVGHLAKMEGLNNEVVDKYNEAMKQYTVDFDEINTKDDE